ncbi:protein CASC4-like [Centruroides sculpturatus]|uniref:protein CASC4-like n=1 Tax=Centruroides sculpturatus TaxID=218467 RepID=UPI000C6D9B54|nr:protein CASC4-like [Centruroides sculpturatus]
MMGSSTNGITRGQLRPHFSGRSPPFIICGLFIALIIVSYCYWNLSFRFNILQKNLLNVEENLRSSSSKTDLLIKQNEGLNSKLQMNLDLIQQNKNTLSKKEEEVNQLSNQLRQKEEAINRANSQIETLKNDADKCKETSDKLKNELNAAKAKIKELETENTGYKEKITAMQERMNSSNKLNKETSKNSDQETKNNIPNKFIASEGSQNDKQQKLEDPDVGQPQTA